MIRMIVVSDFHCGSVSGLTPPGMDSIPGEDMPAAKKLYDLRRDHYNHFSENVDRYKPYDICLSNGDLIDGSQSRSYGMDLLYIDPDEQVTLATKLLKTIEADQYHFTLGTPYHTGQIEDHEARIANEFDTVAGKEVIFTVNDVTVHAQHKAGGSQNVNTRQNNLNVQAQVLKERFFRNEIPKIDLFFRSHCHYSGGWSDSTIQGYRTPALQFANNSKYGRNFDMPLDYGFIVVDFHDAGRFTVDTITWQLDTTPTEVEYTIDTKRKEDRAALIDSAVYKNEKPERVIPRIKI